MEERHSVFTKEQREEIMQLQFEAIERYFESKGKTWKAYLVTAATVVGSLTVILGGLKALLGFLGITIISGGSK